MNRLPLPLLTVLATLPLAAAQDYLTPDLRQSVDRLKQDVAEEQSTFANGEDRAMILWRWANAYAMTGRPIPVNLTAFLRRVMDPNETSRPTLRQLRTLDDYIHELTVYDEQPAVIGEVEMLTPGPFPAASWQTLKVRYTVGEMPLQPGATIVLNRHFISDGAYWQGAEPGDDHYVSMASSNSDARFVLTEVPWSGMHGGFRGPRPQVAFKLERAALTKGDTFTVVYGDTAKGSRGYRLQTFSNTAAPLPIYVKFHEDDIFFSLPIPTYVVSGTKVAGVHGFAPSIVEPGETFTLSVRAEDNYRNRAIGAIPEWTVQRNGEPFASLAAGDKAIQSIPITLDKPGTYRFEIASADGTIRGASNPVWVRKDPEFRLYWGETHGHCGFAEGQGTAEGYFEFGRDDARLDFLTLSEHDIWMDDFEWQRLNELSEKFTVQGEFVAFPGYEWTARRQNGGHHNVFFRGFGFERVPAQFAPNLTDLYLGLHAKHDPEDVLIIPHAHQAADWRKNDVYMERLVEIMSMHGTFEWFGQRYLDAGSQVGFIAASDDHLGHPGYTSGSDYGTQTGGGLKQQGGLAAVFSPSLTGDNIFDALRERSAYATSGDRIILEATLNDHPMGTRQPYTENREFYVDVKGTSSIAYVDLIKNGEILKSEDYLRTPLKPHCFVQVGFESSSEVLLSRDNPRGYRPWIGWLEVENAELKDVLPAGLKDARADWVQEDEDNPNRVQFATATRGRLNNLVLELDNASETTTVRIVLEETRERGTAPTRIRPSANIPSADVRLKLADAANNPQYAVAHEFQVGRYRDTLSLKLILPDGVLDSELRFQDNLSSQDGAKPGWGDYYYVRVRQLDGALAWSSPFWVGGEPPR